MAFERKKDLQNLLLGKSLKEIKLLNVNDTYFCFEEENFLIIDGGIQFILEDHIISLVFNHTRLFFDLTLEPANTLLGKLTKDAYLVKELNVNETYSNLKVTTLDAKWSFYQNLDKNNFPTGDKLYVPHELYFQFENGQSLQIAVVRYEIEDLQLTNINYDLHGEVLVSLNKQIEVKEAHFD